jgi:hypothetical protein
MRPSTFIPLWGRAYSNPFTMQSRRMSLAKGVYNEPRFELGAELRRTLGADLSCIDGISNMTAQMILSELGPDLSAFQDEDHFASWLQLAPKHDITAGKVIRKVKAQGRHRVANALRMSAETSRSDIPCLVRNRGKVNAIPE